MFIQFWVCSVICPGETDTAFKQSFSDHTKHVKELDKRYISERKRETLNSKGGGYPTLELFSGKRVYVDKNINIKDHLKVMRGLGLIVSESRVGASVFVVPRAEKPGERVQWVSMLVGGYITTIKDLLQMQGIGFKYIPALLKRRRVCFSTLFSEKHGVIEQIIRECVNNFTGSKWTIVDGALDAFKERKTIAKKQRRPNGEIRVVTHKENKTDCPLGTTIEELSELVDKIAVTMSTQGVCGR